jgi:hypothetical protein
MSSDEEPQDERPHEDDPIEVRQGDIFDDPEFLKAYREQFYKKNPESREAKAGLNLGYGRGVTPAQWNEDFEQASNEDYPREMIEMNRKMYRKSAEEIIPALEEGRTTRYDPTWENDPFEWNQAWKLLKKHRERFPNESIAEPKKNDEHRDLVYMRMSRDTSKIDSRYNGYFPEAKGSRTRIYKDIEYARQRFPDFALRKLPEFVR